MHAAYRITAHVNCRRCQDRKDPIHQQSRELINRIVDKPTNQLNT